MYTQASCLNQECNRASLSVFDENGEITDKAGWCLKHCPDPKKAVHDIHAYIKTHDRIVGLYATGIKFENMDFTGKRLYGCNFMFCEFIKVHSEGLRSRMSVFDFSTFSDCNMLKSNMQFTSFAGCTFSHTLFTGSDMIQNNFCGIEASQSSFDNSDLYNSRFIRAKLADTSIRDCNIKKTIFNYIEQENVSFKLSNTREAEFDRAGSELFLTAGNMGE